MFIGVNIYRNFKKIKNLSNYLTLRIRLIKAEGKSVFIVFWFEDSVSRRNCGNSVLRYIVGIDSSFLRFKFLIADKILFIFLYFSADLADIEPRTY